MIKITLTERFSYRSQAGQVKRAMFDFLKNAQESDIKFDGRFEKNFDVNIDGKNYRAVLSVMKERPAGRVLTKGYYFPKEKKVIVKVYLPRDFFTSKEYHLQQLKRLLNHVVYHEFEHYLQYNTPGTNFYGDHLTFGDKYGKLHPIFQPVYKDEFYTKENIKDYRYFTKPHEISAFLRSIFSFKTDNKSSYARAFEFFENNYTGGLNRELTAKLVLALLMYMQQRFPERYKKEKDLDNLKQLLLKRINRFHEEARKNPKYKDKLRPIDLNINRG